MTTGQRHTPITVPGLEEFRRILVEELGGSVVLSEEQVRRLWAHYGLMLKWNARLNLTRVVRIREAVRRHYVESILAARLLAREPCSVCDVGSGAGFPGIPIAVVRPDCKVTLVEARKRKVVFLKEASRDLKNVVVVGERAEVLPRRSFDYVVSRAVSWRQVLDLTLGSRAILFLKSMHAPAGRYGKDWRLVETNRLPWDQERVIGVFELEES